MVNVFVFANLLHLWVLEEPLDVCRRTETWKGTSSVALLGALQP